ncbi:hypothetical protein C8J57DRAFT_1185284 [Mycena rebaudengoi]|nr:hypothetical protein C8J57DRAFT_1185284 [Mycena rebaudengoi]
MAVVVENPLIRSSLWFDDGNIVLRAGNTIFKVYRGILAAKSGVFGTMFSLPPPNPNDRLHGCPAIVLTDDPGQLEVFLQALFDPEFFVDRGPVAKLETVLAIFRISHKYFVGHLIAWCLEEIDRMYPVEVKSWDNRDHSRLRLSDHLSVIRFAREFHMPWLLPAAFLASFGAGIEVRSGADEPLVCFISGAAESLMSPNDYLWLSRATANILGGSIYIMDGMRAAALTGCPTIGACDHNRHRMLGEVPICVDPMALFVSADSWSGMRRVVCARCACELRVSWRDGRLMFWASLPLMFGLDRWDIVEQVREGWMDGWSQEADAQ